MCVFTMIQRKDFLLKKKCEIHRNASQGYLNIIGRTLSFEHTFNIWFIVVVVVVVLILKTSEFTR